MSPLAPGLAGALEKHPAHISMSSFARWSPLGENSGTLEVMLDRVATYKEKTEALKAKIKKALTYPIAVIVVAIVVTGILAGQSGASVRGNLPEFWL